MLARVHFSPIAGGCIDLESLKCAVRNNFAAFEFLFVCLLFLQMHIGMCLNYNYSVRIGRLEESYCMRYIQVNTLT